MQSDTQPALISKKSLSAGYIISALPVMGLLFSGIVKLAKPASFRLPEEFTRLGWDEGLALALGIVEIACTIIYVIPRTAVLGAILLTGYLGGAVATHVRIDDPFFSPIIMGVLVWLGLWLRDVRLRSILPLS